MKKEIIDKIVFISISVIIFSLYLLFLIGDIFNLFQTTYIKYSCIIILFIFSFYEIKTWDLKHIYFRIAYLFTLIADLFLLVLINSNNHALYSLIGVSSFVITQMFYFFYLSSSNEDMLTYQKIYLFVVLGLFVIGTFLGIVVYYLYVLVGIYFILLLINLVTSIIFKKNLGYILIIGFGLFVLCDINVGLNNIYINSKLMVHIIENAMWFFYLPSQYLIVNSLDKIYTGVINFEKESNKQD